MREAALLRAEPARDACKFRTLLGNKGGVHHPDG